MRVVASWIRWVTLAGVLVTPITLTSYQSGISLALKGFAAAMLGGMGNPKGALVGGLLLGVVESLGGLLLGESLGQIGIFAIFIAVLLLRPQGLFGARA